MHGRDVSIVTGGDCGGVSVGGGSWSIVDREVVTMTVVRWQ